MTQYIPDFQPGNIDPIVAEWVARELERISDCLNFLAEDRLQLLELIASIQVPAGYAAVEQVTIISPFNLGISYVTVPFDTEIIPETKGVQVFLDSNVITFIAAGNWRLSLQIILNGYSTSGSSRTTNVRFFDITDGVPLDSFEAAITRQSADAAITVTSLVNIPESILNHLLRLEIGGGDTVSNGDLTYVNISLNYIDQLGDLTIAEPSDIAEGALVDLNPDTIISSAGNVTGWANAQTGGPNYNLAVGSPVLPLTLGQQNGLNVVESAGTGVGGFMEPVSSVLTFVAPYTIFFVGGWYTNVNGTGLLDSKVSFTDRIAFLDGTFPNTEIQTIISGTIASQPRDILGHVFALRVESGNHRARISGSAWQTDATVGLNNWQYCQILQNVNSGLTSDGWAGRLIVFNSGLTDAEMDIKFDRLLDQWNL